MYRSASELQRLTFVQPGEQREGVSTCQTTKRMIEPIILFVSVRAEKILVLNSTTPFVEKLRNRNLFLMSMEPSFCSAAFVPRAFASVSM